MVRRFYTFVVALLLCFHSLAFSDTPKPLILACEDKENFPFYMGNGLDVPEENPGVSIEMLSLLETSLPVRVVFKRLPWKRCKISLKRGEVDGIFNASFRKDRMALGVYPMKDGSVDPDKRITTISYSLYSNKANPVTWDPVYKRIEGARGTICAPLGYSIVKDLKAWKIDYVEKPKCLDCFILLDTNSDRISGVAALEFAGDNILTTRGNRFDTIEKMTPPLITKEYYLMLSHSFVKDNPELSEAIWSTLRQIRENHSDRLLRSYLNQSEKNVEETFQSFQ